MHIIYYEDLVEKPKETIKKLCEYLGKEFDDSQLDKIVENVSFESMKKNPMVNREGGKKAGMLKETGDFIRKGKVGDWLNHFSLKYSDLFDEKIEKSLQTKDIRLNFGIEKEEARKFLDQKQKGVEWINVPYITTKAFKVNNYVFWSNSWMSPEIVLNYKNFETRKDDIWVFSILFLLFWKGK